MDVIKTYVQTHTGGRLHMSPVAQVALFFETGAAGGLGCHVVDALEVIGDGHQT